MTAPQSAVPAAQAASFPRAPTAVAAHAKVGRYLLLEPLGRGGMGSVHRARDLHADRDVALKLMHDELLGDPLCRARFVREGCLGRRMAHPNIVAVHDFGEAEGRLFIAMELVRGWPLGRALRLGRALPLSEVLAIGMQLGRALGHVHSHGVVHGDVKPGNLIWEPVLRRLKLADFGVAVVAGPTAVIEAAAGSSAGTLGYLAPEQVRGGPAEARADLYAAGAVLFGLLTGQRPVVDASAEAARRSAGQGGIACVLEELRPDAPLSLRRIVERCLAALPAERFASGDGLADALAELRLERAVAPTRDGIARSPA